jgi:small-conductance mechanosensitive channel
MSFSSVKNIGISLLASAGFLTAILSLSAQKTLFALFSGLQLALSQAVRIGDVVVIEKETGIVEEINFTYIKLKLGDKRRMVVPISYFIERPFENWSHGPSQSLQNSIHLFVDYLMPLQPLRKQLAIILKASSYWDGGVGSLQVAAITERAVELRIQISAANADNLSELRAFVREKMLEFIKENYPQYLPIHRLHPHNTIEIEAETEDKTHPAENAITQNANRTNRAN